MAVKDYSTTAALNSLINGVNVAEGCAPANLNDAVRQLMKDIRDMLNGRAYSLSDRGVTGSGADETAAVQAAIDALPATGGEIIVPFNVVVKNLKINGTARDKSNVVLRGLGWGTGFKLVNTAGAANLIDGLGAAGCRIENMTLDGNKANNVPPVLVDGPDYENYNGVYLEQSADCCVRGCLIKNMAVLGICPGAPWTGKTGADRTRIENNTFKDCAVPIAAMRQRRNIIAQNTIYGSPNGTYGIVIDEFSAGNQITDNDVSNTNDVAIFLFRATDNIVSRNQVTSALVSICLSDASNDNIVDSNECDTSTNSHIKLVNGCLRNTVTNNTLETATQYNIVCEAGTGGSSYTIIRGNRCRAATFSNIAIFGAAFTSIRENYAYEAVGSGIYVSGACDWSEINDNFCWNNSNGSANDAGIRLVAQNNIIVKNNRCFDSSGTPTQNWGIRCNESFVGTVVITGNDLRFNKTAGMVISGGTPVVKENQGFISEAYGTIALGAAATAVTVTHGMDIAPDYRSVRVTFYDTVVRTSKVMYVANVGATTFEIRVDAAPGTATVIAWEAKQTV